MFYQGRLALDRKGQMQAVEIFCTLQQRGNPSSCVHVGFNTIGKVIDWMMQEEDTRVRERVCRHAGTKRKSDRVREGGRGSRGSSGQCVLRRLGPRSVTRVRVLRGSV